MRDNMAGRPSNKELEKRKRDRIEKFFVEIFNMVGLIGLSAFAFIGFVLVQLMNGIPLVESMGMGIVVLFFMVSLTFAKRLI